MQIPEPVRNALREIGIMPQDWRKVAAAFDAVPHAPVDLRLLSKTAAAVEKAERLRAIDRVNVEGKGWQQIENEVFLTLWTVWGDAGVPEFSKRFKMGKSSIYRKLSKLGIRSQGQQADSARRFETAAEISAEIDRLQAKLAELQAEGRAA